MMLKDNTVLITGGNSGIGFELARQLSKHNTVIICGRSEEKLSTAKRKLPFIHTFKCDISELDQCRDLAQWVIKNFPKCNMLINNAAIVHKTHFADDMDILEKALSEITTNLYGPMVLCKYFIPILSANPSSQIINVTTGLVFAPRGIYPIYNATKAGLHSFTQTLRLQIKSLPIQVKEVLFPVVATPWHGGKIPEMAIQPEEAVKELLSKLTSDRTEIKIGKVKLLSTLSRLSPSLAIKMVNRIK